MSKLVRDYLQEKEYNIMLEKFYYFLSDKYGFDIDYSKDEIQEVFGGAVSNWVYPWSNEKLDEVFGDLNLEGKRALVVGSSGDQALHCIHRGATDVTIMDSNMWTIPFVELKIAGIKNLSYDEFMDGFAKLFVFGSDYYPKISHDLSEQARAFWDSVALDMPWYECIEAPDNFFHYVDSGGGSSDEYMSRHCFYTSQKEYERLQANLLKSNVNIVVADINEFDEVADGKYDYIMLSNIFDYMDADKYLDIVKTLSDNRLNDGGKMQIDYIFEWKSNKNRKNDLLTLKKLKAMCKNQDIDIVAKKVGEPYKASKFSKKTYAQNITLEK